MSVLNDNTRTDSSHNQQRLL